MAEFVSPGSKRTDHVAKRADYATRASGTTGSSTSTTRSRSSPATWEASWATSTTGYVDGGAVTGVFAPSEPFPVRLDLDALG